MCPYHLAKEIFDAYLLDNLAGDTPVFGTAAFGVADERHRGERLRERSRHRRDGEGHSLRVTGAQHFAGLGMDISLIMLIGRWSSDAFLHYIRKQVEQFSNHVATMQMLTFRSFRTIPDVAPRVVSAEDPRQRNHQDNAETRRNIGGDKSRRVQLPSFSLFH